ncbi:TetR family transcriptional regulator [Umezawaea endophytica]|uniref:TetR family transcriptional regulator n=1 Tax=Umezawaea endophytica TaxID=1654476 RepID=A0A9X3A1Z3_9PSEU|nr:TetR family transcriptional regulator [Umezawaea endophytica]MCS7480164.1 TetR family transcriptional regulator [Umezawaea endophytica]
MAALDAETIMLATEDVLRRHGSSKATVVDVARALGVSHAAVYRHFPSKAALREAVTRRWLAQVHDVLAAADDPRLPPPERLRDWLVALHLAKRRRAADEPELFETYRVLVLETGTVAREHVSDLLRQLEAIIVDGVGSGAFAATDPATAALAVFEATAAFHHPAHVGEWSLPGRDEVLADVCALVVDGLRPH